ncbi:T9SS type A sorting domain-containing protein [Crocinitomicaceae bacterium]|nr:T9SS type A sorting domain-containing protein [Crocinitomicaceae bacterium]
MKQILLSTLFLSICNLLSAQTPCDDGRYSSTVFSDFTKISNITYGSNTSWTGGSTTLKMDFYEPEGDTETERPLLVWVHGGSFIGGSKTDPDMVEFSERFSKMGYACASIDYRLGFFPFDSANAVKAVVRAVQDLRGAVRYFYKDKQTVNQYKIDTNKIFIGGSSAGAITALHMAYLDDACKISDYLNESTISSMGGLEGTSGSTGYSSDIQGVVNGCGALARYSWIEIDDVPLCSIHGTADDVVKYNRGVVDPGTPLMYLDGSRMLHERACAIGLEEYFYTFPGAGHVPYISNASIMNTTVDFIRDFLVKQMGCDEAILQPENDPMETAFLYPINDCDGNPIDDECTSSGIAENNSFDLEIYPNPAQNELTIKSDNILDRIEIYNLVGQRIYTKNYMLNEIKVNLSNIESGSYIVRVFDNQNKTSKAHLIEINK